MLVVRKVPGSDNPADVFTKYVSKDTLNKHLKTIGITLTSSFITIGSIISLRYFDSIEYLNDDLITYPIITNLDEPDIIINLDIDFYSDNTHFIVSQNEQNLKIEDMTPDAL